MGEKKWNPDLWKTLSIKPVEIKDDYIRSGEGTGGFLPFQDPETYYEVRGIMPSSKNETLIIEEDKVKKRVRRIED